MPVRLVVDTNVVVSGIINGNGAPGKIVDAILRGEITVVHSDLILMEYEDVLHRSKFAFDRAEILDFMVSVEGGGEYIVPAVSAFVLPDEKDRPFLDAALTADCAIITGNSKHFLPETGVEVLSLTEALTRLQPA